MAGKFFHSLFRSLFDVFAWLDDDGRVSASNFDVVYFPESLPDATIDDSFLYSFHGIPGYNAVLTEFS